MNEQIIVIIGMVLFGLACIASNNVSDGYGNGPRILKPKKQDQDKK